MTTTYPGALDSYTVKVNSVDDVMAAHVNNLQDAIVAIEGVIGEEGQPGLCEGRLSLESNVPISITDQTAKTVVYFTPYKGDRVSIYNGSGWPAYHFTQKSVVVPGSTVTPFDIFAYDNAGDVGLQAVSWTNNTTRATALTKQGSVHVKSGATGYRYLGTGRTTTVSGQTEDSEAKRLLWNYYNRVPRTMFMAGVDHAYNTAAWRYWNNDATMILQFVAGLVEEPIYSLAIQAGIDPAVDGALGYCTMFYDGLINNVRGGLVVNNANIHPVVAGSPSVSWFSPLGYHFISLAEYGVATGMTFAAGMIMGVING